MKWLFILLLALNIGFFAWQFNQEEARFTAPTQSAQKDNSRHLVLLRELDAELAKTVAPGNSPAAPPAIIAPAEHPKNSSMPTL
ncbi:MAG TPA: hypothetical protein VJM76_07320 [Gammaproteobacteria bacterium]|nr:hypothetical protein [Gammaproteobacteria bacterium]